VLSGGASTLHRVTRHGDNLNSAIEGEPYECTEMYSGFAKTAREEGFDEIAELVAMSLPTR
jgi:rubrerythrin